VVVDLPTHKVEEQENCTIEVEQENCTIEVEMATREALFTQTDK
jgi:hypothetical protein